MPEKVHEKIVFVSHTRRNYTQIQRDFHLQFEVSFLPLREEHPDLHRPVFRRATLIIFELPVVNHKWETHLQTFLQQQKINILILTEACRLSRASRLKNHAPHLCLHEPVGEKNLKKLIASLLYQQDGSRTAPTPSGTLSLGSLIGESANMTTIRTQVKALHQNNKFLTVSGETGCGKTLLATIIHQYHRPSQPCVEISAGAISDTLYNCEFFGAVKGAYTGAETRPGFFEKANGGSLIINEMEDLSPPAQAALLGVFDDGGKFYPVGSSKNKTTSMQTICTVQDYQKAQTMIRKDLWHRIAQLRFNLLPLRQRVEDIPPLARHILRQINSELSWEPEALVLLQEQPWPGNVRQLKSLIKAVTTIYHDRNNISASLVAHACREQLI